MTYIKISPLGTRNCRGTFDCFFDTKKYSSCEEADKANDLVVVNFVKDEHGTISFEFYHCRTPEDKKYHELERQYFPAGIDVFDDNAAVEIATKMFLKDNGY